jgi:hypothetical protein
MKHKETLLNTQKSEIPSGISKDAEPKDIEAIVYQQYFNNLKPKIINLYPAAPMDKVNKIIRQKWLSIGEDKRKEYFRRTLKNMGNTQLAKKQEEEQQ